MAAHHDAPPVSRDHRPPPGIVSACRRAAAIAAPLLAMSCATVDELAPPLGPAAREQAAAAGLAPGLLERGRTIYLTRCARCHQPEPVMRYTAARWAEILPVMVEKAALGPGDAAALEAYLLITRRTGPVAAAPGALRQRVATPDGASAAAPVADADSSMIRTGQFSGRP